MNPLTRARERRRSPCGRGARTSARTRSSRASASRSAAGGATARTRCPPAAKATGQYINSVLAKVESLKAGYDEAIMLNEPGFITDGSGENVFIVRDGVLTTPPTRPAASTASRAARDQDRARPRLRGPRGEPRPHRPVQRRRVLLHGHGRRDHADPRGGRPHGRRGPPRARHEGAPGRVLRGHQGRGSASYADWLTYVDD